MDDFKFVQFMKSSAYLVKYRPYFLLFERVFFFLSVCDLSENVTVVCVFYDNVKTISLKKSLFVRNNIRVVDRCEDSDFVEGVLLLLGWQVFHFDLFQSVELVVKFSPDFVHWRISALAKFFQKLEVLHICFIGLDFIGFSFLHRWLEWDSRLIIL